MRNLLNKSDSYSSYILTNFINTVQIPMKYDRIVILLITMVSMGLVIPFALKKIQVQKFPLNNLAHLSSLPLSNQETQQEEIAFHVKIQATLIIPKPDEINELDSFLSTWSGVITTLLKQHYQLDPLLVDPIYESRVSYYSKQLQDEAATANKDLVKQVFDIVEFENFGEIETDDVVRKNVNLCCLVTTNNRENRDEATFFSSFEIPAWGILVRINKEQDCLQGFEDYLKKRNFLLASANNKVTRSLVFKQRYNRALRALEAISKLSHDMPHMEILQSVANPFNEAVAGLTKLQAEQDEALEAKLALVNRVLLLCNAISADPSTIPQQYISQENLLAIYAPLLLPVFVPIVLSIVNERKLLKKKVYI